MSPLSAEDTLRYSRQIILPDMGMDGQQRLREARVLVVGMGGLGSPVAMYLAAGGVGTLGLADFDCVEPHNLQRQIIHDDDTVGTAKLVSARQRLQALNPATQLELHTEGITVDNALEVFAQYDLIVDGSDNFGTRYLNNDAAVLTGKPLVYGSIFQFEGQVSLFHPASGGPCYRCLFPDMPAPGEVPNCQEAGVLGALCGVVGSLQAMEAIKWITGVGQSLLGRLLTIDARDMRFRTLNLKRDPHCPTCGDQPRYATLRAENYSFACNTDPIMPTTGNSSLNELPWEISPQDADQARKAPDAVVLDVRKDFERNICHIEPSRHIELDALDKRFSELPQDQHILVYCHHGKRSLMATEFLRQHGYHQAQSIRGGIDAWAVKIDSDMARY